ncbi:MAG: endonuclease domain-containing protein [Candidatus Absconditabacterales bacterium]
MRQKPTPAEEKMREGILKHRPLGYKFTRQKPIGSFIVDFYCAKLSLAIEVDGEIHKKRRQYDRERSNSLSNQGVSIARYRNNDVLTKIDTVYKDLLQFMKKLANQ